MDATLAFVTASFAHVRPGDVVLDPFCGTGGNLLAACYMSRCAGIGADADARTLLRGTEFWADGSLKLDARLRKAQNMANVGGRRERKRGAPPLRRRMTRRTLKILMRPERRPIATSRSNGMIVITSRGNHENI